MAIFIFTAPLLAELLHTVLVADHKFHGTMDVATILILKHNLCIQSRVPLKPFDEKRKMEK